MVRYPPIDFPVYGISSGWDGPRWLDFVEGQAGEPCWAVWLMHAWNRDGPPTPWVLVGTLPAQRYARLMAPLGTDPVREVAYKALFKLVNRVTPPLPDEHRDRYWHNAMEMVAREADDYAAWTQTSWQVDGGSVVASTYSWAGARAGFTTALPDVAVVVLDAPPAEPVHVAQVGNGGAYHFRADAPLNYAADLEAAARTALGAANGPEPEAWPLHEDQLLLLRDEP